MGRFSTFRGIFRAIGALNLSPRRHVVYMLCCTQNTRGDVGGGGGCPISISDMNVGEAIQGHGSTCDCTCSVLIHIALCMCFAFFVCLPGGAFCFASHPQLVDFSGVPRLMWGTQFSHCLRSTVYPPPPALDYSPLFFTETGQQGLFCQTHISCSCACCFPHGICFLSVKRHCLQGWCLGGVQGVLRRVWGAREDAQAPLTQGEQGRGVYCHT